jgi:hypothetical protein
MLGSSHPRETLVDGLGRCNESHSLGTECIAEVVMEAEGIPYGTSRENNQIIQTYESRISPENEV